MKSFTAILVLCCAAAALAEYTMPPAEPLPEPIPQPVPFRLQSQYEKEQAEKTMKALGFKVEKREAHDDTHPIEKEGDIHKREASPYSYYYPYYNYPSYGSRSIYPYSALSMYPYSSYRSIVPSKATTGYSYYFNY